MNRLNSVVLGAFSITVIASLVNAACSSPTEIDHGSTENAVTSSHGHGYGGYGYGPTSYGYGGYGTGYGYGYGYATNVADDTSVDRICEPGASVFCHCEDQSEGTKLCGSDGNSFSDCTCQ